MPRCASGISVYCVILMLFSVISVLQSQNNQLYTQYTTRDGLPSNLVYEMIQDHQGFIWISTDNGISRFDGKTFQNFGMNEGLKNVDVLGMVLDPKGRMWLAIIHPKTCYMKDNVFHYLPDSIFSTSGSEIPEIYVLNDTNIVISTPWKFVTISSDDLSIRTVSAQQNNDLSLKQHRSNGPILRTKMNNEFKGNRVVLSTKNNKLTTIDSKTGEERDLLKRHSNILKSIDITNFFELIHEDRYLMIKTSQGCYVFDLLDSLEQYHHYLPNHSILRCFKDKDSNLWITTKNSGIFKFTPQLQPHLSIEKNDIRSTKIDDIKSIQSFSDEILVHHKSSFTLMSHSLDSMRTIALEISPNASIVKMKKFDSKYFILSQNHIHSYDKGNKHLELIRDNLLGLLNGSISNIKEFHVLNNNHFLLFYDSITELKGKSLHSYEIQGNPRVTVVRQFDDSTIFVGSQNGVFIFNPYDGNLVERLDELPKYYTVWIEKDQNNRFVFVFRNGVINVLKNTPNGLKEISSHHSNNLVFNGANLHEDRLAIASSDGLLIFKFPSLELIQHSHPFDLQLNSGISFIDRTEEAYILASENQIALYHDSLRLNIPKTVTYIESIQINGGDKNYNLPAKFSYDQRNITFNFSTPYYQNLSLDHEYQLLNHDNTPIRSGEIKATYSNLNPGSYRFQIKPVLGEFDQMSYSSYSFHISKPWWKTHVFYLTIALALLALAYYFYRQTKLREHAKSNLLQYRLNAIHAQMNPHFLFNGLQSVQYYVTKKEPSKAVSYLTSFATLVRKTLESSAHDYISIADEIAYLTSYLALKKEELDDNLNYDIDLSNDDLHSVFIPSMILQPFLENSFVHGFTKSNELHKLNIRFESIDARYISCTITDNGLGLRQRTQNAKGHRSFASKAIDNKLKLLNQLHFKSNSKNTITLADNSDNDQAIFNQGATVKLVLPIIKKG